MAKKTDREQTSTTDARDVNPPDAPPIRSSFSIDRNSRRAIRRAAKWYGATQGDVVNLAPLLYALTAERSLQRRRENLDAIKTQVEQAVLSVESIRSIAPHLEWAINWTIDTINEVYEIEVGAIENHEIHGVEKTGCDFERIRAYEIAQENEGWELPPSPFVEALKELQAEANSEVVTNIEEAEWVWGDRDLKYECLEFPSEEELHERFGRYAGDVKVGVMPAEEAERRHKESQRRGEQLLAELGSPHRDAPGKDPELPNAGERE